MSGISEQRRLTEDKAFGYRECASCRRPESTLVCNHCSISDVGQMRIFYCSSECQKKHWQAHQSSCRARRRLGRSVSLLGDLWTDLETQTYFGPVKVTNVEGKNVHVEFDKLDWLRRTCLGQTCFTPFPAKVAVNQPDDIKVAVLYRHKCDAVAIIGYPLLKMFLGELGNLHRARVQVKHPALRVQSRSSLLRNKASHTVLLVQQEGNNTFIVDLTGYQYGWAERLYAWDSYRFHRIEELLGIYKYEETIQERFAPLSHFSRTEEPMDACRMMQKSIILQVVAQLERVLSSTGTSFEHVLDLDKSAYELARSVILETASKIRYKDVWLSLEEYEELGDSRGRCLERWGKKLRAKHR